MKALRLLGFLIIMIFLFVFTGCSKPKTIAIDIKSGQLTDNRISTNTKAQPAEKVLIQVYVLKDTALYDSPNGKQIRNDITRGRIVTILEEQGDWTKILIYTYDTPADNIGWVKSSSITGKSKGLTLIEGRLNSQCNLMDGPPPAGKPLPDIVYANQQVLIEDRSNDWVRGQFAGGLNGWIPEKYIEFIGPNLDN